MLLLYLQSLYANDVKRIGVIIYAQPFYKAYEGFKYGLQKLGYKEGKNVIFYVKNINGNISQVKNSLEYFKNKDADLILTTTTLVILEVKKYIKQYSFQVIFNEVGAPIKGGVVKSLNNHREFPITGVNHLSYELTPKRVEIFKDAFPKIKRIVFFYNPDKKYFKGQTELVKNVADKLNIECKGFPIKNRESLINYLNNIELEKTDGILMFPDAIGVASVDLQIKISHKFKIPLMILDNVLMDKGGCIGYSPSFYDVGIQSATLAKMIFNGVKAENIPVQYPDKLELAINLKEIKKLNLFNDFNKDYLNFARKIIK